MAYLPQPALPQTPQPPQPQHFALHLKTYGWAILIIAALLALAQLFGVFNQHMHSGCVMPGPFSCTNTTLSADGTLSFSTMQDTGSTVNITSIACGTNSSDTAIEPINPPEQLGNGSTATFVVTCYEGLAVYQGRAGSVYSGYLTIYYTAPGHSTQQSAAGALVIRAQGAPSTTSTAATSSTSLPTTAATSATSTAASSTTSQLTTAPSTTLPSTTITPSGTTVPTTAASSTTLSTTTSVPPTSTTGTSTASSTSAVTSTSISASTTSTTSTTTSRSTTTSTSTVTSTTTTISSPAPSGCRESDSNVPAPAAPHGLLAFDEFGYLSASTEAFLESNVMNSPYDCGVVLAVRWNQIEPENGTYNWSYIDNTMAPWISANKTVDLLLESVAESTVHEYNGQNVTPSWVLNDGVSVMPASACGVYEPAYWQPGFLGPWHAFIAAVEQRYGSNPNIGYIRWGLSSGGEDEVPYRGYSVGSTCYNDWAAAGYTNTTWFDFLINQTNYYGSQGYSKLDFIDLSTTLGYPNQAAALASNASKYHSLGLAYQGLGRNCTGGGGWCSIFKQYGSIPDEMQLNGPSSEISCQLSSMSQTLNTLLMNGTSNHAQVFELNDYEWKGAYQTSFCAYSTYHVQLQGALANASKIVN